MFAVVVLILFPATISVSLALFIPFNFFLILLYIPLAIVALFPARYVCVCVCRASDF